MTCRALRQCLVKWILYSTSIPVQLQDLCVPLRVAFTSELSHPIMFLPIPAFFLTSHSDAFGSPFHPECWHQRRSKRIGEENCCSSLLEEGTLEKFLEGQKSSGRPCVGEKNTADLCNFFSAQPCLHSPRHGGL